MAIKKPGWSQVKAVLSQQEPKDLLKLVGDLYRLSKDNRAFIESRFLAGEDTLEHYKGIIADALYPDVFKNKPVRLSVGKKAISDYRKATNDTAGTLELMVHYLEQGNEWQSTATLTSSFTQVWNPCWTAFLMRWANQPVISRISTSRASNRSC
jgi:hypothetical protein